MCFEPIFLFLVDLQFLDSLFIPKLEYVEFVCVITLSSDVEVVVISQDYLADIFFEFWQLLNLVALVLFYYFNIVLAILNNNEVFVVG